MRRVIVAVVLSFASVAPAIAQNANGGSIPRDIGNRANGKSYEPTPNEVVPREQAAGIRPTSKQEQAKDAELGHMDKSLLRSEGLSTKRVPPKLNPQ